MNNEGCGRETRRISDGQRFVVGENESAEFGDGVVGADGHEELRFEFIVGAETGGRRRNQAFESYFTAQIQKRTA